MERISGLVFAFAGKQDRELDLLSEYLKSEGIENKVYCNRSHIRAGHKRIQVNKRDYFDAVSKGSIFCDENNFETISWLSPAGEIMNELKSLAMFARVTYDKGKTSNCGVEESRFCDSGLEK
ncbi:MAG: hypothetical protein E7375_03370 [Clostridiales bacterium]|nr:hypothetical protein [Clostridiales bacterium]